jgi:hypothetical protein
MVFQVLQIMVIVVIFEILLELGFLYFFEAVLELFIRLILEMVIDDPSREVVPDSRHKRRFDGLVPQLLPVEVLDPRVAFDLPDAIIP